jgi:choline dehydrogenase-like flavoprotein
VFIDARTVEAGSLVESEVAIVGAGAAGIAIAAELTGSGFRTVLLESGGFTRERSTNKLNAGEREGQPYGPLEAVRSRFLGGSSNCWGGYCRPFDERDFAGRPWIAGSQWPISRADLDPYYARARDVLELGSDNYDASSISAELNGRARLLPFDSGELTTEMLRFSPPVRFGAKFRSRLESADDIRCFLHANVLELVTNDDSTLVKSLRVASLSGNEFRVESRLVVLAAGGIENPRLLLLSNSSSPAGLGNHNDLVGRYFMEHPLIDGGVLKLADGVSPPDVYDNTFSFHNPEFAIDGVSVSAYLSLSERIQQQDELMEHRLFFATTYAGEDSPGTEALRRLVHRSRRVEWSDAPFRDAWLVGTNPIDVSLAVVGRGLKLRALARRRRVLAIVEPEPTPDSRVTLSRQRDELGLNRSRVTWLLTDRVRKTIAKAQEVLGAELRRAGVGRLDHEPAVDSLPADVLWCWHHIGTTRMSRDPKDGVVDADCKLHGVRNVFVAGSSVFPTAGCDMPTLTIVALAIRLAEHLRDALPV